MTDADTMAYAPLLTITQDDIDELGVEGAPQEGLMTVAEFKEKGMFKIPRKKDDSLTSVPWKAFYADPERILWQRLLANSRFIARRAPH